MSANSEKRMDSSNSDVISSCSSRAERQGNALYKRGESRRTIAPRKDEKNFAAPEDGKRSRHLQRAKGSQDLEEPVRKWVNQKIEDDAMRYGKAGPSIPDYDYDRDELLKQLDELKDRLARSGNLVDKGKEKISLDKRMACRNPYELQTNWVPMRNSYHPMQRQELGGGGFYPPRYQYHQAPMHYQYMDDGIMYMDAMEPSSHHPMFSSSCSSRQCQPPSYSGHYSKFPDHPGWSENYSNRINAYPMHTRWPEHVNSEVDGSVSRNPPTARLGKICHPIGYGAPFFTCSNCFELLFLPKNVGPDGNNSRSNKMSCGSCSTVFVISIYKNKLVFSYPEAEDSSLNCVKVEKSTKTNFSLDDHGDSGCETRNNTYTPEAEEDNWSWVSKEENRAVLGKGVSLQDHFEYSNKFHRGGSCFEKEGEKVILNEDANNKEQILMEESLATSIELSSTEFLNTGTTFDSSEASREGGDRLNGSHTGIESKEDFEEEKANVIVNGHLIPARLIKKAEKVAGPVQPGNYWYDFRAGFWGAIGGPCLGIIPPFIGEFNYPMLEHCAAGNTQVFVNGRELSWKDLNLLVNRGLPTERNRSYILEISGRILDDHTGEELQSLGKLAPTVERMKRGFGMRPPIADA